MRTGKHLGLPDGISPNTQMDQSNIHPEMTSEGQVKFRPRARIIQTLGRDLISNHIIAIQELIKNAYDADANEVHIKFEPPLEIGKGAVIISDDGDGMTLEDIQRGWMEPATISKLTRTHSDKGRRVTGEKGVGRFAAARRSSTVASNPMA